MKFLGYKTETHKISFIEFYLSFYFIFFLLAERLRNALNRGMNQEFDRRTSRELNEAVPQTEILGIVSLNLNWLRRWLVPSRLVYLWSGLFCVTTVPAKSLQLTQDDKPEFRKNF